MDEGRGIYSVAMFQKRDIREDVSFLPLIEGYIRIWQKLPIYQ